MLVAFRLRGRAPVNRECLLAMVEKMGKFSNRSESTLTRILEAAPCPGSAQVCALAPGGEDHLAKWLALARRDFAGNQLIVGQGCGLALVAERDDGAEGVALWNLKQLAGGGVGGGSPLGWGEGRRGGEAGGGGKGRRTT